MGIDLGTAQLDATLLGALTGAGVPEMDARELARLDVFGGANAPAWLAGLRAAAALLSGGSTVLDWGALPAPWDTACPALLSANGTGANKALLHALSSYGEGVQAALISALSVAADALAQQASKAQPIDLTAKLNASQAAATCSVAMYLAPIDAELVRRIQRFLIREGTPVDQRRKAAGEQMLEWLTAHGRFVRAVGTGNLYYLFRDTHKLFNLESNAFRAWLYKLTGVNPASATFAYLKADCESVAHEGEAVNVCRFSHWDGAMLRVSRFDGTVLRLDGETIDSEANGDGPVLFEDAGNWTAYTPDYSGDGSVVGWWTDLLNTDSQETERRYALRIWLLSLFFMELCPTQVILVLHGEAGSGKSMLLRVLYKLLFGPTAQIGGVPDKPDGFIAAAAVTHLLVLDNLDNPANWLQDRLARISTGGVDYFRRLYTSNDLGEVTYRTWVAITSRTPDTLKRDDLADRLLILPTVRIEDDERRSERSFLHETVTHRSVWWGDLLTALNRVVALLRREGLPARSVIRMADFESLGRVIARAEGQESIWERVVKDWGSRTATLLLHDSVITDGLERWLELPGNQSRRIDTRTLHQEATLALFGTNRPDDSWPKSARSFGRYLAGLRRSLRTQFDVRWEEVGRRTYYTFSLKP